MICPRFQAGLVETTKQGVVLDHCMGCGGIWLDRGELAKIIAHMKQMEALLEAEFRQVPERREAYERPPEPRHYDRGPERHYDQHAEPHHDKRHYKIKSGFEGLFDMFD